MFEIKNAYQPTISTIYTRLITKFLDAKGVDVDHFLAGLLLQRAPLEQPDSVLPMATFQMLMEEAARYIKDENLGLHIYSNVDFKDLGIFGYTLLNSETVGDALAMTTRYYSLAQTHSQIALTVNGDSAHYSYQITSRKTPITRQDSEMTLRAFVHTMETLLDRYWRPREVRLQHAEPKDLSEHRRLLCNNIYFGCATNEIIFDSSILEVRIENADLKLSDSLESTLRQLLRERNVNSDDQWLNSLQNRIVDSLGDGVPRIDTIAAELNMSRRTLQRRISEYGMSFKYLLDNIRQQLAVNFLEASELSLMEIAFMLGYSEYAAFSRAFSRWTQFSPHEYRLKHRAQPPTSV